MLTIEQIKKIIPHRAPFLLIDEIHDLVPRVSAKGVKHVTKEEFWIQGHFPEQPVMPGVLIIEALAQVGAVIMLSDPDNHGKIAYFAGIDNVRFRRKVVPGDTLNLELVVTKIRGAFGYGDAVATVNGETVCSATCSFAIG